LCDIRAFSSPLSFVTRRETRLPFPFEHKGAAELAHRFPMSFVFPTNTSALASRHPPMTPSHLRAKAVVLPSFFVVWFPDGRGFPPFHPYYRFKDRSRILRLSKIPSCTSDCPRFFPLRHTMPIHHLLYLNYRQKKRLLPIPPSR